MFTLRQSKLRGCYELQPKMFEDSRGRFVKVFHEPAFKKQGLCTSFVEEYYSVSHNNVIRGMHFQLPPNDLIKMVYCVEGEVIDAVVDLRKGSSTFGEFELFEISAAKANILYIPTGMAHGFCVQSKRAIMVYKVSKTYSPTDDAGVLWNSIGIPWPITTPILSVRDAAFRRFDEFISPFHYD